MHEIRRKVADTACHSIVGRLLSFMFADRIPARGIVVDTSDPLIVPSTKAQLFWGFYERAERRFIRRYLRKDRDVIELGASLGVASCFIRGVLPRSRKLVCVEAYPALVDVIRRNLETNSLLHNVTVRHEAIDYDASGRTEVSMATGRDSLGGCVGEDGDGTQRAKTTTLSRIIEESGVEAFTLVSDIEGAEAGILLHDAEALRRCDQIIIELHHTVFEGRKFEVEDLKQILIGEHGFTLRDQHGPVCVLER